MVTDGIPEVEADRLVTPASSCPFTRLQSFVGNPGDLNGDGKENPASPNYLATTGQMYNCGSDYLDDAMYKIHGLFPLGNTENQPVNLYAVSFGFDFCQAPAAGDTSPGGGSLLWRASKKYGGGECLSATEPDELDEALRETFNLIKNDAQSFVAPVVPVSQTNRTQSGEHLYVALFSPREGQQGWPGQHQEVRPRSQQRHDLQRVDADVQRGERFGDDSGRHDPRHRRVVLGRRDRAGRRAARSHRAASARFSAPATSRSAGSIPTPGSGTGNLGGIALNTTPQAFAKTNSLITPAMLGLTGVDATTTRRNELIDYIYGFDSYDENDNGNVTEKRTWVLGDIIHSVPLIVNYTGSDSLIIVGSNDGMLHAFDDGPTGGEVWAFIPPDVLGNLNRFRPGQATAHPFFVDASPKLKQLSDGRKILVFGLGRGGRAYYALDVTNRAAPTLLWRINNATTGFAELGMTFSAPSLTKFANGGSPLDVAVFAGGYDPYFDNPTP
jgi:type IV pilus assembly protein PilY1